jgi:hypothetical protein
MDIRRLGRPGGANRRYERKTSIKDKGIIAFISTGLEQSKCRRNHVSVPQIATE